MKIGVDIRTLMDKQYSGVSEYTYNLLRSILLVDQENNYKLFYNSWHDFEPFLATNDRVAISRSRWPNKLFNYILQFFFHTPKLDKIIGGADI